MVYIVVPLSSDKDALAGLKERLREAEGIEVYNEAAPHAFFVSYKGTTKELAEAIGYGSGESGRGIVVPLDVYHGWAAKDMWEWIHLHAND